MKSQRVNRVTFYSNKDLSCVRNLTLSEPILHNFDTNKKYDINDIIELYQIKLYIDNEVFLTSWTEEDIKSFKETTKDIWKTIYVYFTTIDNSNILELFDNLETNTQHSFWSIIEQLKVYKNISEENFNKILNRPQFWIRKILYQKNIVNYFGILIREYLINYSTTAELFLTQYEERHIGEYSNIHFPNCLSIKDKELIIIKYIEKEDANLNYIRLIINSRDSSDLKLSPRTRLKAKRVERKINNEILKNGITWNCGNEISFSQKQEVPIKVVWDNNIQKITYGTQWIEKNNNNYSLFRNFSILFNYTDLFGNITLISKSKDLDVLEYIKTQSKNEYPKGVVFTRKSNMSHIQILLYCHYLNKINKSIEDILSYFIKEYINDNFCLSGFKISFPSKNASNLEKVRMIAPEPESILKQYKIFVEDGFIDPELLQIDSTPCRYKDIPSLCNKKYVYGIGNEFQKLKHLFFSNQITLFYIEPYENKYNNLYSLLINENVSIDSFEQYQKTSIDMLIADGYLFVDSDRFVRIKKADTIIIIGKLFHEEVISYWHSPTSIRSIIDKMEEEGLVYFRNTLFSEPEQKYFNYYLNKSEFTNGLDLRNKYAHGANGESNKENENVYYIFIKILILIFLKIDDDLNLRHKLNDMN